MSSSLKVMFLDESGDHNLETIDPQYPMFVLGGVIVDLKHEQSVIDLELKEFKKDFFGNDNIVLHTADITRNRNGFEKLIESNVRTLFYERLNGLMKKWEYKVVACAVHKDQHMEKYGLSALDPYMLALNILVERFCFEIGDAENGGIIIAEKRNPSLDHELELAWLDLKVRGTHFLKASEIERRIRDLMLRDKKKNIAGLQLADLVVTPIGRYVLGKPVKEDFEIIRSKFRKGGTGKTDGAGLVILPKK